MPEPLAEGDMSVRDCRACDLARHICPGCGASIGHGETACSNCNGRDPITGRTPAEEQLATWDYYLDHAIEAVKRDPARDLLLDAGYDTAKHLSDLQAALAWPTPNDEAIALAERALLPAPLDDLEARE